MLCHKIVNTTFQCKRNYVVLIILQMSAQGGTRAAGSVWKHFNMSRKWVCVNYQFNNCDMKDSRNINMIPLLFKNVQHTD